MSEPAAHRRQQSVKGLGVLLSCFISMAASAQPPADSPSPYSASIDVAVIDLAVVVRDGKGRPITGLKPENFHVWSDGVRQEIYNFSEVSLNASDGGPGPGSDATRPPATAATPSPGSDLAAVPETAATERPALVNHVVVLFDNLHLHPGSRDAAIRHVRDVLAPLLTAGSTEVMVAAFNVGLEILQPFTIEPSSLSHALDRAKGRTGGLTEAAVTRERLKQDLNRSVERLSPSQKMANTDEGPEFQELSAQVDSYAAEEEQGLRASLSSLSAVLDLLSGLEGRKALLFVSDTLALSPGEDAYTFLDQVFPNANARMKALDHDRTRDFKEVTARASALGVTLYVLATSRSTARGITTADRDRPWNPMHRNLTLDDLGQTAMRRAADILAADTGGIAIVGASDLKGMLGRMRSDFEAFYSLGIQATGDVNINHELLVEVAGVPGDPEVRSRRAYSVPSEEARMERSVTSRLDLPRDDSNPLEVRSVFEVLKRLPNGETAAAVRLLVPWKNILLQNTNGVYRGELVARMALRDGEGRTSTVRTLSRPVELPEKYFAASRKESYTYTVELSLPPGRWLISIALTDTTARVTSYVRLAQTLTP